MGSARQTAEARARLTETRLQRLTDNAITDRPSHSQESALQSSFLPMTPPQQLAEENVQATVGPAPALRGVGSYGPEAARREVAPSQASERRFTRVSRVTRQEWAPSILIFILDILT